MNENSLEKLRKKYSTQIKEDMSKLVKKKQSITFNILTKIRK
jgi:hypothetical protein